jgi:nucleoside-diphosphate-sugar epimerase
VKAFVTGGSGFVGQNLIRMLVGAGHEVRALARSSVAEEALSAAGAITVPGSLLDFKTLQAGMIGCDTVFHCAALMEFFRHRKEMEEVNVHGTRCIVEASRASGVPCLVFISAAAVISSGRPVIHADESRPYPARVFGVYSRTKAEAEKLVLEANGPGFVTVAVRPPGIWGAGTPTSSRTSCLR